MFTQGDGQFYTEGDLFRQPELAQTLRAVAAQGAAYMYTGAWAEHLVQAVRSEGGKVTLEDMAGYEVMWPEPVHTTYREYEVYGPGLPGHGGVNTVEAFNLLEAADWREYGHHASSPEGLFWLMQILRTWRLSFGSPAELATMFPGRDLSLLSRQSKETAKWIWQQMEQGEWVLAAKPTAKSGGHSAAVVAVDASGNIASVVHSSNALLWAETGIFVDGVHVPDAAGYQLSMLAQSGGGNRLPDPSNPLIILRDGRPALGSSCTGQIHSETMQRLVSILDFGMDPQQALEAPWLMTPELSLTPPVEQVAEGQFDFLLLEGVREMGQPVEEVALTMGSFLEHVGYWIGVVIDPKAGTLQGAAPMMLGGTALGY
jgi:gamma-glutamyltranspeptidase/glutathione hydrolase